MSGLNEAAAAFEEDLGGHAEEAGDIEALPQGKVEDISDADGSQEPELDDDGNPIEDEDGEQQEGEEEEGKEEAKADPNGLDPEAKVKVVIDGKQEEVTVREALDGYIRQETFHQRMNQLRDTAQELANVAGSVNQQRQQYAQGLQILVEQLQSLTPQEPDWAKEYAADPVRAGQLRLQWDQYKTQYGAIEQERARVLQEAQMQQQRDMQVWAQQQQRQMLAENPEWNDAKTWEADKAAMTQVALDAGFTMDEINGVLDARQMKILKMAAKYASIQANKPRPDAAIDNTRTRKSGSGASRTPPRRNGGGNRERLARTGSVRDAAAVFAEMLDREG